MRLLPKMAFAALLLGTTMSVSAFAQPGCGPNVQRAESEGGGVATVNQATRKAESEGGGVATVNQATRKAESEGGGVSTVNQATRKAESEGGGVATVGNATSKQMASTAQPCK